MSSARVDTDTCSPHDGTSIVTLAALVAYGVFAAVALVARTVIHLWRTRAWPWIRPRSPAAWIAQLAATVGLLAPPVGVIVGPEGPASLGVVGVVLIGIGVIGVAVAQAQMGASWRAGVDPSERTELVTHGLFGIVRNPIYSGMALAVAGMFLVAPNAITGASLALVIAGIELLVRAVEEPYLRATHGDTYDAYVRRTARFVPTGGRRATR